MFDFDGTLVDSNEIKREAFFTVSNHLSSSKKIMFEILSMTDLGDRYDIFNRYSKRLKEEFKFIIDEDFLVDKYTEICEKNVSLAQSILGFDSLLNYLKKTDLKVIISSATPIITLKKIIINRKIDHFFDHIYGSPESKVEHIKKVIKAYNISPKEILYVGDSEVDMQASLISGSFFIGVGNDYSRFLSDQHQLVNNLDSIKNILDQFN
jgi:phosphoglycolate phosphatase-like HAD superfamily hydrolase